MTMNPYGTNYLCVLAVIAALFVVDATYGQSSDGLQSESPHATDADSYHAFVESKLRHTYPATAMRMLQECGNVKTGICIDVGCGTGRLDVELGKLSDLEIIGLDINPDMQSYFEQNVREAGFQDRIRFVVGDAQQLPFPDNFADVIVSRGVLIFIPDLAKCLREVDRVLKPTGVAFLGGRYLYAPQEKKLTNAEFRRIVQSTEVPGAQIIEDRGQWVKIIGPQAADSARNPALGPAMLAVRCVADYGITTGDCLLLCRDEDEFAQQLRLGFLNATDLKLTALYSTQEGATQAQSRMRAARQEERITSRVGKIDKLPFPEGSFDLVAGAGPMLIWSDRQRAMKELYRVLRPGGYALVGGRYSFLPEKSKVASAALRSDARATGIASIRVLDDMGQWVEVHKPAQTTSGAE